MMKRKNCLLLLLLLLVSVAMLCGCGRKNDESKEKESAESVKESAEETPTPLPTKTPTPTVTPTPTPLPTATPTPSPTPVPELLDSKADAASVRLSWSGEAEAEYELFYREKDSEDWTKKKVKGTSGTAGGLKNNSFYEFRILKDDELWLENIEQHTEENGSADPFMDIYTTITVGEETKYVAMSSKEGCLGAKVWPQHKCSYYQDPELETAEGAFAGGEALKVTENELGYCYLRKNGRYSLYVSGTDATGSEIFCWVDADLMLIDVCDLFSPEDDRYGIKIERTNAYSSIFTAGGSSTRLDLESEEDTRYDVIRDKANVFSEDGYNPIPGITGEALPKYGPATQMPVIWDMALSLITAQKNALNYGTVLLIYDGYRPNSTSHLVCDTLIANNFLGISVNGTNLARGFGSAKYGPRDYIGYNSNHNKGIAVDLTLIGFIDIETLGDELVMQSKIHTLDFRCNMVYNNDNADLLYNIMMTGTGLQPLSNKAEWWHFELKRDLTLYPQIGTYIFADYEI